MRVSKKYSLKRRTAKRNLRMRGGNENAIDSIVKKFGLVKHTYGEVYNKVFDDISDLKPGFDDCCAFEVTVPKNSFFIGKLDDGSTAIIVSRYADNELKKKLEQIAESVIMYVLDDKLLINLLEGWDQASDTGYITTRSLTIEGETKIRHIKYDVSFQLKGDYSQEEGNGSQNVRGSWAEGAGVLQVTAETERAYYQRQKEMGPASLAAMSRLGLDRELADEVEEARLKTSYGDVKRVERLVVKESVLYTPSGDLDSVLEYSDDSKAEIKEAQEKYEEFLTEHDAEMARQAQAEQDMMESVYYDHSDDEYYGGRLRRSRRVTRKMRNRRTVKRINKHSVKSRKHRKPRRR